MEKKATIYDVALKANVSLATVSRVINNSNKVSDDTKERVLNAIAQLNYKPNSIAIELASKRNTNVAIIVPELKYTYVAHVVAGLMDKAKELGYDCLIYTTKESKKDMSGVIAKVLSYRPNGIIIFNDTLLEEDFGDLLSFDIPLVTLGEDLKTISSVSWHYQAQIVELVKDAMKREKEIYFIKVKGSGNLEERVLRGIKQAFIQNGKEFTDDKLINVNDSYEDTYNHMKKMIPSLGKAFILSTRDSIALAALNAALDLNKKVPEDLEFLAVLGTKYSELSRPKLSSFSIDMRGLGKTGMEVLAELINSNRKELITRKLSFEFVKRGSTL